MIIKHRIIFPIRKTLKITKIFIQIVLTRGRLKISNIRVFDLYHKCLFRPISHYY